MTSGEFSAKYESYKSRADASLLRYMPPEGALAVPGQTPDALARAMRYSALSPGKRVRPALLYAVCHALGADLSLADPYAAAVEMIHAYSLIHDDLPCMDDDDLRRGRPTNHKVFGEALALLAGDALLSQAAQIMALASAEVGATGAKAMAAVMEACGAQGMVAGQVLDILYERGEIRPDDSETFLHAVHAGKTAALFRGCCACAGHLAGAPPETLERLTAFGELLGMAFQAADDLLDETGNAADIGKSVGKDSVRGKLTHPGLLGAREAKLRLDRLTREALDAIAPLNAPFLAEFAQFLAARDR